jgi:hypothetical protein
MGRSLKPFRATLNATKPGRAPPKALLPLKELATVSFGFRLKMNNKESHENSMYPKDK